LIRELLARAWRITGQLQRPFGRMLRVRTHKMIRGRAKTTFAAKFVARRLRLRFRNRGGRGRCDGTGDWRLKEMNDLPWRLVARPLASPDMWKARCAAEILCFVTATRRCL
jgi:hypothetical protein